MGATSVTGTGPGIARGPDGKVAQHKPENHCGCGGCGDKEDEQPPKEPIKRGCVVTHRSGGRTTFRSGGSTGIRVC
jgi:hypothetical protein